MMNVAQRVRNAINFRKRSILSKYNNAFRRISTSEKAAEDLGTITMGAEAQQVKPKKKIRNWQTYGFDFVDQRRDYFAAHVFSFAGIVFILWGSIFIMTYYPDLKDLSWATREARIQVRRREILGLPMVDMNYIDPALVKLPPDEDIPQEDIII